MLYFLNYSHWHVYATWFTHFHGSHGGTLLSHVTLLCSLGIHCRFSDLGSFLGKVLGRAGGFPVLYIKWASDFPDKHTVLRASWSPRDTGVSSRLGQFNSGPPPRKQLSSEGVLLSQVFLVSFSICLWFLSICLTQFGKKT